jgi:hypothetical protein
MDRRAAIQLREAVVQSRVPSLEPSQLDDLELVKAIRQAIQDGRMLVVRAAGEEANASDAVREQRRLVKDIEKHLRGQLRHAGRQYRLVADVDLEKVPGRDNYEVVRRNEAQRLLDEVAKQAGTPPEAATLLGKAGGKLTADWQPPFTAPDGLVLLRRMLVVAAAGAPETPVITPSQMVQPKDYIEIELVDEEGLPFGPEQWELVLPDGTKQTGTLGPDGRAMITDIPPGTCQVAFPELDSESWSAG